MALLTRNVTGDEVLALWRHVSRNGPVDRRTLLDRYFPADATDPDQSDFRKPLKDAIEFLVETGQFANETTGYVIADRFKSTQSPRVALLRGIHDQDGEDEAYAAVLDTLVEADDRFFDRTGSLVDRMSDRRPAVTWNPNRLSYWARMMNAIGVVTSVNADAGEDATNMLALSQPLLRDLLRETVTPNEPYELDATLRQLDETTLPVFAGATRDRVADYIQRALTQAKHAGLVELGQDSDFGRTHRIRESGYNAVTLRVTGAT
jgi:hypothetical protein